MSHVKAHHSRHRMPRRGSGGPIGVAAIATLVGTVGIAGTALFSPSDSAPKPHAPDPSPTVQIPKAACSKAPVNACNAAFSSGAGK
ncbi:hypothetical protein GCM10009742_14780 [Kribbella karoonensis]|jgi:hypothetical protein|uniref:Small secreted domain DUF320 n=1 Tax=Kribbella karoonensis TaxID=324851 RepID=A0ABP4P676_9ACTN